MIRAQHYIGAMLEGVVGERIASEQHRTTFAKIKEKLANAEDFEAELRALYRVAGLSDFALGLLWIAESVERDDSKTAYSPEEQEMIVTQFRSAVGDWSSEAAAESPFETPAMEPDTGSVVEQISDPGQEDAFGQSTEAEQPEVFAAPGQPAEPEPAAGIPEPEITGEPSAEEAPSGGSSFEEPPVEEPPVQEPPVEEPPVEEATMVSETEPPEADAVGSAESTPPAGEGSEGEFGTLMERFVESMQSGSDDRDALLNSVLGRCNAMIPDESGVPEELREFSRLLVEFLTYITENGFMDDVRVMNILSNVSGPVASWAQSSPDDRAGVLEEALEILRTFKSLFE